MSIVGTRPPLISETNLYEPRHKARLSSITTYTFVNGAEETTCAIDRGYAVMKQFKNAEGQVTEERYFDADGNPVKLYDSYYGVEHFWGLIL